MSVPHLLILVVSAIVLVAVIVGLVKARFWFENRRRNARR